MRVPALREALARAARELGAPNGVAAALERPRDPARGDLATNLAFTLAPTLRRPPREIARKLLDRLDLAALGVDSAEIAGDGFINFRLSLSVLHEQVRAAARADRAHGRAELAHGLPVVVEFVSANPTGPLHVGHGRGAALGDAIASLLEWTGHRVQREFYVNDMGAQIDKLGESVYARFLELSGWPAEIPEGGYHGEYVREIARSALERGVARRLEGEAEAAEAGRPQALARLREFAVQVLREEQARDLADFCVRFDLFYEESRLYRENQIPQTLAILRERGLLYEKEGAVWLKTSQFGDDKDRVLIKSDGSYTYFLPDIAYHRNKAERGFRRAINIWGADHYGYVPRMQAAMEALGLGRDFVEAQIVQLVTIQRGRRDVKFSKRAGDYVTLRELFEETGVDVARYFFLNRRPEAQMVFDLDLALERSEKNPVYKVQYAHARMCSIFRRAGLDPEALDPDVDLAPLSHPSELEVMKPLVEFPETVEGAALAREPHRLANYLEEFAGQVNRWYHEGNRDASLRVLGVEPPLQSARLVLARAIQVVLRNGLSILGIEAPGRMEREEEAG